MDATFGIEKTSSSVPAGDDATSESNNVAEHDPGWRQTKHLAFFGLTEDPFLLTPNRKYFFRAVGHTAILGVIQYGLNQGEGFIIVIGEVGTGKTLLLRLLLTELKNEFDTALILSPLLSPRELLQAILIDTGHDEIEIAGIDNQEQLLRLLNSYLYKLSSQQRRLVVIIDEAQDLPLETIEQLRLLSNFESDHQKLLQIIMVGQPELQEKLNNNKLRQLLQRVTIMETLPPITAMEMHEYVQFRLEKAGRSDMQMDKGAHRFLWRQTKGIPRRINRIMGRALLVSYAHHSQKLTTAIIKEAATSLKMTEPQRNKDSQSRSLKVLFMLLLLIVLGWGLLIYFGFDSFEKLTQTIFYLLFPK